MEARSGRAPRPGPRVEAPLGWGQALAALALLVAVGVGVGARSGIPPPGTTSPPTITVDGNRLVAGDGAPTRLVGVNRSGTEYACAQGWGVFDGPSSTASIDAIRAWGVNTVRVPLNEDCWLGISVPPAYAGATYRAAIRSYVARLGSAGLFVVLDLHWSAPGSQPALSQRPMPDASHAIAFWRSVAATFRRDPGILFELFNEPHGVSWRCWRDGCRMPGGWRAAGMQQLVETVRATGARQPIIVDGLDWANDLAGWLRHRPHDPLGALVAGVHVYPWNRCSDPSCWRRRITPVAAAVPVVASEVGEDDCRGTFVRRFLDFAGRHDTSPIVWTWDANEGCRALVRNYAGAPTRYGAAVRDGFASLEHR